MYNILLYVLDKFKKYVYKQKKYETTNETFKSLSHTIMCIFSFLSLRNIFHFKYWKNYFIY